MNWNLQGMTVVGLYMGEIPVRGLCTLSRVKYGGGISHHITLDEGFDAGYVKRTAGEGIILDNRDVERVIDRFVPESVLDTI